MTPANAGGRLSAAAKIAPTDGRPIRHPQSTAHEVADARPSSRRSPDFSARSLAIGPTGIRKMFDLATAETLQFGLGEPDFQPPAVAIEAFHKAMVDGYNKYTTQAGYPPLREAIAASWAAYRSGLDSSNVCITMSGTNALLTAR
ncbi:MAG: hypothetical protein IPG72_07160 [Ardenticatenales bacterium]|nr:hypothetical protein [Ardenticatenales bacterium]